MKKTSFKKNLVLTLVAALLFTAIQWPQNMMTINAEDRLTVSDPGISNNTVRIVESVQDRYDNLVTYNGNPVAEPTDAHFSLYKVVSGNTTDKVDASEYDFEYIWYDSAEEELEGAPTDAGSYTLEIVLDEECDYVLEDGVRYKKDVTIAQKELKAVLKGKSERVYDGTTNVSKDDFTVELSGVVGTDDVTAVIESIKYVSPKVSSAAEVVAVIALKGKDAANYSLDNNNIKSTGNVITKAKSVLTDALKTEIKAVKVTCGQKLSDVKLSNGFEWVSPSTVVKTGGKTEYAVKYTKNADKTNYTTVNATAKVVVTCAKSTVKAKKATTKKAGNIKYKKCKKCGTLYDYSSGKKTSKKKIQIPALYGTVESKANKKTVIEFAELVIDGDANAIKKITVPSKYKSFISVKSKKIVISKVATKNYKKIPGSMYVKVEYYSGATKKVKVKLNIPEPKLKVKKQEKFYAGENRCYYTVSYNIPNATKVQVKVVSGVDKTTKSAMNKWLSGRFVKNKDKAIFSVRKSAITGKVKFQIKVWYGKKTVTNTIVVK